MLVKGYSHVVYGGNWTCSNFYERKTTTGQKPDSNTSLESRGCPNG